MVGGYISGSSFRSVTYAGVGYSRNSGQIFGSGLKRSRSLNKNEFVLSEVYDHADQLAELHPQNHHIHDKIRQQLKSSAT